MNDRNPPHGAPDAPPDTPAWSAPRRRVIERTWWLGASMVVAALALGVADRGQGLAEPLLDAGVTTVIGSAVTYVGGASGERCVAWLANSRRDRRDRGRMD